MSYDAGAFTVIVVARRLHAGVVRGPAPAAIIVARRLHAGVVRGPALAAIIVARRLHAGVVRFRTGRKSVRAEAGKRIITVGQDGTGEFRRITDAINSIRPGNSGRVIIKTEPPGVHRRRCPWIDQGR
ncbi:Pectinesterase PPME1 [Cinnamomum micranthum f. kanehirae]|uniref:Pectinesterase PPME1 n=1 Tax=Cinnamomum micranthum f. kanehirae TaxID=337451 RepID=A0A443PYI4_9MAGN|nr:Pectinesterase PPME1 [Cinnamomum micranthum f. kanehirae]